MKGLPCPCPALPHFWQLGSHFMAEGSGTQAPGKGPLLSVQLLRAQYEGLRRQQKAQAHVVVLPKGRAGWVLGRERRGGGPGCGWNGWLSCGQCQGSADPPGGEELGGRPSRGRARAGRLVQGSPAGLRPPANCARGPQADSWQAARSSWPLLLDSNLAELVCLVSWAWPLCKARWGGGSCASWLGLTKELSGKQRNYPWRVKTTAPAQAPARGNTGSGTPEAPRMPSHLKEQPGRFDDTQKPFPSTREEASSTWQFRFIPGRRLEPRAQQAIVASQPFILL